MLLCPFALIVSQFGNPHFDMSMHFSQTLEAFRCLQPIDIFLWSAPLQFYQTCKLYPFLKDSSGLLQQHFTLYIPQKATYIHL